MANYLSVGLGLRPFAVLLPLLACSGPVDTRSQQSSAAESVWCSTGQASVSANANAGSMPSSQAEACLMMAGNLPNTDVAGQLALKQKACELDDQYCLAFVGDVDRLLRDPRRQTSVPDAMVESAFRMCADDRARYRQGINDTPSICYEDARIATTQRNDKYARAFVDRACKGGETAACSELATRFNEADLAASYQSATLDHSVAEPLAQRQGSRPDVSQAVVDPSAGGNSLDDPTAALRATADATPPQSIEQRVGAMCRGRCDQESDATSSMIGQATRYRAAACEQACMYNNLPPDWPNRNQYRLSAEQNAALVRSLQSN
jgi:hypothetical protein